MSNDWDVVVLGAGGAGMMCAAHAARLGKRVLAIDHGDKLGRKILISGGGRCNFTNTGAGPKNYFSENEHFAKSAMARFAPQDFIALVEKHGIAYYEKKLGQLFCQESAQSIVDLLRAECAEYGAEIRLQTTIETVEKTETGFIVHTDKGDFTAPAVVVATGGLSIPKIGATDIGYKIARGFGLSVTRLYAALVSFSMPKDFNDRFSSLSGVSVDTVVSLHGKSFRENILFTHTGVSGPAILQASLHWFPGESVEINLSPDVAMEELLMTRKREGSRKELRTILAERFTDRLGEKFAEEFAVPAGPMCQVADQSLRQLAQKIHKWVIHPATDGGYGKAEVTRGGVATTELSSKTLEAKKVPGLYFIGEVVDVTGWLGGYNFQWAWASAVAAAESL